MYKRLLSIILCIALCFSALSIVGCKKDQSFTVTFTGGHEDSMLYYGNEVQVVTNSNQIIEPIYFREGYNFVGWNVSISRITSDTTIVAQWKKYQMEITFNANGGKDDEGNRTINITADSAYEIKEKAPKFKKKGYTLSWSPELETITKSCQVDAIWTLNEYNFIFKNKEGHDFLSNTQTVKYNQTLDFSFIQPPNSEGEKFVYWKDQNGNPIDKGMVWDIDEGAVLTPVYTPQEDFVITYDLDGGNRLSKDVQRSFNLGSALNIASPSRIGYSFDGWQINGGSDKFLSSEITLEHFMVDGNLTDVNLKATWNNVPYTARFDADGGVVSGEEQKEFLFGYKVENLPTAQKENYEFIGWFYDGVQIKEGDVWGNAEDLIITAKYRAVYKIKFSLSPVVSANNVSVLCKVLKWGDIEKTSSFEQVEITLLEGQSLFSAKGIAIMPVVEPISQSNVNEYMFGNYWKYVDSQNVSHKIVANTVFSSENLADIHAGDTIILVPHIKLAWTPNY